MEQIKENPPASDKRYTYFAFISYKSEDAHWARWLKRELSRYRLPTRTHKKHPHISRRCTPVFLDKTNLTPGVLDEHLCSEVQSSKYLIIICSRNTKANPKYIDDELKYFLNGGGDAKHIIPFIVDDCERPEKNCFTPALTTLCEKTPIVGANIHDDGKRSALLKTIASMLGITREELESEDYRRRKKQRIIAAVFPLFSLSAQLSAGIILDVRQRTM